VGLVGVSHCSQMLRVEADVNWEACWFFLALSGNNTSSPPIKPQYTAHCNVLWRKHNQNHIYCPRFAACMSVFCTSELKRIYIYAFSRRFYPKRITVYSGYTWDWEVWCDRWHMHKWTVKSGAGTAALHCFTTSVSKIAHNVTCSHTSSVIVLLLLWVVPFSNAPFEV